MHYFPRRAKHINDIMYNNEVHQLCASIQPYLNWTIFKYLDLVICKNLNAIVICLAEKGVIVPSYITFSTSQNYECNAMKSKKYHTVGTIPKSNIKIVERGKTDFSNTQTHDHSMLPVWDTVIQ